MAAHYEAAEFDCEACRDTPDLARYFGCTGPPANGQGFWMCGTEQIDRCPVAYLRDAPWVWDLMRSGAIADWRMSLTEQAGCSEVYLAAWSHARMEINAAQADRLKRSRDE